MAGNVQVVIADDNRLLREGLRLILAQEDDIEIVGEAVDGQQVIDVVDNLQPDVLILDIGLRHVDGIKMISSIRTRSPKTRLLMFAASTDEHKIFRALKTGAKGYISESTSGADLVKAIHAVHKGEVWVERKLIAKFFEKEADVNLQEEDAIASKKEVLTAREQEVLRWLATGNTNKEIAEVLFISEKTVKSHVSNIFKKLHVTRRLHAILYAIQAGLK